MLLPQINRRQWSESLLRPEMGEIFDPILSNFGKRFADMAKDLKLPIVLPFYREAICDQLKVPGLSVARTVQVLRKQYLGRLIPNLCMAAVNGFCISRHQTSLQSKPDISFSDAWVKWCKTYFSSAPALTRSWRQRQTLPQISLRRWWESLLRPKTGVSCTRIQPWQTFSKYTRT